jgi:hypothetical protein
MKLPFQLTKTQITLALSLLFNVLSGASIVPPVVPPDPETVCPPIPTVTAEPTPAPPAPAPAPAN